MYNLYEYHFSCGDTQDVEAQADQLSLMFHFLSLSPKQRNAKVVV